MGKIRVGFTLVELLIVIVIIGILSGVLMYASFTTTDSAKAAVLVSNLRNAKAAGIVWLAENPYSSDVDLAFEWTGANMADNLKRYVDNNIIERFDFYYVTDVGFFVGEPNVPRFIIEKALTSSRGALFDENGVLLTDTGGDSTVCVKVK
jgi:prepilin-type N-terminal cleavage/methylation domain-containing protein